MQIPSFVAQDEPNECRPERRFKRSQVLLVGFDAATCRTVSGFLSALTLKVQISDDPYSGLAALIDEPGAWMTCIVNARAFGSRSALERYVRLFAFECDSVGMILANAQAGTIELLAPIRGVSGVTGDIANPRAFQTAIATVMDQRGYPMGKGFPAKGQVAARRQAKPVPPLQLAANQAVATPLGKGPSPFAAGNGTVAALA